IDVIIKMQLEYSIVLRFEEVLTQHRRRMGEAVRSGAVHSSLRVLPPVKRINREFTFIRWNFIQLNHGISCSTLSSSLGPDATPSDSPIVVLVNEHSKCPGTAKAYTKRITRCLKSRGTAKAYTKRNISKESSSLAYHIYTYSDARFISMSALCIKLQLGDLKS
ncbi:hypothetical protein Leryth_027070, partial [Lithospermum erythrorhizon]